jgi:hypothetical protein
VPFESALLPFLYLEIWFLFVDGIEE